MDLIEAAKLLIPALIKLPVTSWDGDLRVLEDFEKRFCFLPDRQPLYTAKGLGSFFAKKDGRKIYVSSDAMDTTAIIFKCGGSWVILGPFVCEAWQENSARILLAACKGQESAFLPYKLYRCRLPLLQQEYVVHIAALLLEADGAGSVSYELEAIDMEAQLTAAMDARIAHKHEEIEVVNQRYADEIQLIEAASQGDIVRTLQLFEKFGDEAAIYHFVPDRISDWTASAAITRTEIRLAAVKAGLPPAVIDSISQEYAQQMHYAVDEQRLRDLQRRFIIDLCSCIRKHQKTGYSPYVKRAVEYIDTHISQDITVHTLCELNHVTRKYFAKLFSQETGKTVKQYLMQVRCERAADLLQNSQLLIQEISHYVGYEDNNYFSKIFKATMGVSPLEYRRRKTFYTTP